MAGFHLVYICRVYIGLYYVYRGKETCIYKKKRKEKKKSNLSTYKKKKLRPGGGKCFRKKIIFLFLFRVLRDDMSVL